MANRTMFDAININNMPLTAQMYAYYLNGKYAVKSVAAVEARFSPDKYSLIPIDVIGDRADYARVFDVETGDITADQLETIFDQYKEVSPYYKTGGRPVVYCDRASIGAVREGTGKYILNKDYYLWVSTLDGTLFRETGVIACQFRNVAGQYDVSEVYSDEWVPSPVK